MTEEWPPAVVDDLPEGRLELLREVTTMALYVSLSILAVLIALPVAQNDNRVQAGLTVLATGLGLCSRTTCRSGCRHASSTAGC